MMRRAGDRRQGAGGATGARGARGAKGARGASEEHLMRETDQRDRSIDRLLRRVEPGADLPATDACVDAETLAAWMDGSLSGEALHRAEHHAAGCARCQAMLASMARTAPDTAARPWWRLHKVKWIVPIAAAATAVVLWVSVDRQEKAAVSPATTVQTSRASEPIAPPTALADAQKPLAASSQSPRVAGEKDARARSKAEAPADLRAERKSLSKPAAAAAVAREAIDALGPSPQARSGNAQSVASAAAATPARAAPLSAAPTVRNAAPVSVAEPSVARPLAETVTAPPESAAKELRIVGRAADAAAFATGVEIMSPEPAFRWRLLAPATIQRSTDGGVTWRPQVAPAGIVVIAGSSPARDVCWIVGRAGSVLLSTDGTTWQLRPFPEAVNLTAVRATDAKTAVVTTSDGRQFSTTDGGATWSRLPLQEFPARPF